MMSFGIKLKEYRTLHNISQEELAKKLNTTKQVISRYENDQRSPKLSVAIEYSAKLGIPLEVLVDDKKSLEPNILLSSHEKEVITAYRNQPAMQEAVDRLLGIQEEETVIIFQAARSKDNTPPGYSKMSKLDIDKLENAPETEEKL